MEPGGCERRGARASDPYTVVPQVCVGGVHVQVIKHQFVRTEVCEPYDGRDALRPGDDDDDTHESDDDSNDGALHSSTWVLIPRRPWSAAVSGCCPAPPGTNCSHARMELVHSFCVTSLLQYTPLPASFGAEPLLTAAL
eukprot:1161034-Pelagomonas_calceolata.AAC.10